MLRTLWAVKSAPMLEVNDWLDEQQQQLHRLWTHNESNVQTASLYPQRLLLLQPKFKHYLSICSQPGLPPDWDKGSQRPTGSAQKQSHRKRAETAWCPGTQVSQGLTHHTQFHREASTIKLKVWGRSKTNPLWEWVGIQGTTYWACDLSVWHLFQSVTFFKFSSPPISKHKNMKGLKEGSFAKLFIELKDKLRNMQTQYWLVI